MDLWFPNFYMGVKKLRGKYNSKDVGKRKLPRFGENISLT